MGCSVDIAVWSLDQTRQLREGPNQQPYKGSPQASLFPHFNSSAPLDSVLMGWGPWAGHPPGGSSRLFPGRRHMKPLDTSPEESVRSVRSFRVLGDKAQAPLGCCVHGSWVPLPSGHSSVLLKIIRGPACRDFAAGEVTRWDRSGRKDCQLTARRCVWVTLKEGRGSPAPSLAEVRGDSGRSLGTARKLVPWLSCSRSAVSGPEPWRELPCVFITGTCTSSVFCECWGERGPAGFGL